MIGIDLFAGAGGLSLGAEMAGIHVVVAIEQEKNAAATYRKNHQNTIVINDDIHKVDVTDLMLGQDDTLIVFGGPPCQGYSYSNKKTRTVDNPNNTLFVEFFRVVKECQPSWFLFENVEGFKQFQNGEVRENVKRKFEQIGYNVTDAILLASRFGVPQNRHRYIMIGNNRGIDFSFPEGTDEKFTVEDAISDLPELQNGEMTESLPYRYQANKASKYARLMRKGSKTSKQNFVSKNEDYVIERYKYISQGQNWRAIPDEMMQNYANKNNCHSGIYRRLIASKPSVVISNYRKNMLIHPYEDRGLSVREAARLQSFPDSYLFEGSIQKMQQQIGNAVPPLLAKAVFEHIIRADNCI
jgi:DNA (cytosine-5)-methyltransferase 1